MDITTRDMVAEAEKLQPLLEKYSEEHDKLNALHPEVVEALHESGLFGMWLPKDLGGAELVPTKSIKTIATLTYADPATAWVTMATALATGTGGAYMKEGGVPKVFDGDRFPTIAGQGTKAGTAVPVEGGFLLSGDWQFGSGLKHADWIHTGGMVVDADPLDLRIFVLKNNPEWHSDASWDVLGLIGTGSVDYSFKDVFVPEDQTYDVFTETALRGGDVFKIGTIQFALLCHTGFAVGVGRRLLDELIKLVQSKKGRAGQISEGDAFLEEYARTEAKFRAAEAWCYSLWGEVEADLANGAAELTTHQKTLVRMALHNVTEAAYDVMNFVIKSAATVVIRPGVIRHFIRDMITASTHLTVSQPVVRDTGRQLVGLAPNEHWVYLALAPDA